MSDTKRRRKLVGAGAAAAAIAIGIALFTGGSDDDASDKRGRDSSKDDLRSGVSPNAMRYPREVIGRVGEDTAFVNEDSIPHTFTSDTGLFDSGTVEPAGTFAVSTLPVGTYRFHCSIHPDLTGTMTIE